VITTRRVFGAWLVVAAVILLWIGRGMWATADDWQLVGTRSWTDPASLLRDHNQHFSLVPVVVYKAMFEAVGFSDYWPYRVVSVVIHLGVVVLLWVLLRRLGVRTLVAAVVAGAFALFNGGVLVVAQFQMPLALGLSLGLFLIAMRTSAPTSRTVAGAVLGCLAAATSAIAIPVIAAAGAVAWRRRGVRTAVLLVAPAAVLYAAWWVWDSPTPAALVGWGPTAQGAVQWSLKGVVAAAEALAGMWPLAILLSVAVGSGVVLARRARLDVRTFEPLTLALAAVAVLLFAYLARGSDPTAVTQSRFTYVTALLWLPVVAVGMEGLISLGRQWALLIVVPLAVGLFVNVSLLREEADISAAFQNAAKVEVAAMLRSPAAADTPVWIRPWWSGGALGIGDTTWGFLKEAHAQGHLDLAEVEVPPDVESAAVIRLRMAQLEEDPSGACEPHKEPVVRTLRPGSRIGFRGGGDPRGSLISVRRTAGGGPADFWADRDGDTIEAVGTDPASGAALEVEIAAGVPGAVFYLCE